MLDFVLVMGHVPGTNIDLTFYQIVIGLPIIGLAIYLIRKHPLLVKRAILEIYVAGRDTILFWNSKLPTLASLRSRLSAR